jgi:hypothetical protein
MNSLHENEHYLYDAVLTRIDADAGVLIFTVADTNHCVTYPHVTTWSVGTVGCLRLSTDAHDFAFHSYVDQRLRRAPQLDDVRQQQWGWRIGEDGFRVRSGILPGQNGAVVRRDTQRLVLELPREYLNYCSERGLQPATVLRAFIADLCELFNWVACPREDNYSTNGSDERLYADAYFQRCFGWVDDPEYRKSLQRPRHGGRHDT